MAPKRILVVDDAMVDRMKLVLALKSLGYEVQDCSSGEDALRAASDGGFSLIMLDLLMPGMDGYQVLEALKADNALHAIPVVIVSSTEDADDLARVTALGATDHLRKPFTPEILGKTLNQVL